MARPKPKRSTCITCSKKPVARGLCSTCRAAAKIAILRGEFTEKQLIDEGLLLPAKGVGRPSGNGFAKRLKNLRK